MSLLHLSERTCRRSIISAAFISSLLLAGCSSAADNIEAAPSLTSSQTESSTEVLTTTSGASPASAAEETTVTQSETSSQVPTKMIGTPSLEDRPLTLNGLANLTPVAIRTGSHNGFDRFVVEFTGEGKPGWYTRYTTSPVRLGSGEDVDYQGTIALVVGVQGTPWSDRKEGQKPEIKPGHYQGKGNIASIRYTGSFEAQSQFVLGMKEKIPYSINYLENPTRLVVDFAQQ